MKSLVQLDEFYKSLDSIEIVNSNLDKKRDELSTLIKEFNSNIQNKSVNKSLYKQNEQLSSLLQQTIDKLKNSSSIWLNNFSQLLQREKFRSDLKNYFIIIIFGKVKAGKSSLGNFIAKNNTTDKKPVFFKYDEAGNEQAIKKLQEIDENNEFDTNNLECTIEIQGFKLSGLAWIDTPGLGSMVEANGKLAKEYIQSADYIIYPTSSNSPLQQDEIAQLNELFEQKKPVTVCITKSDTKERQKDSNGKYKRDASGRIAKFLVNKSSSDRHSQEMYVKDELKKILKDKNSKIGDIFSISAHTAQVGIDESNEEMLDNSNIPKFYELVTEVVKQKAASLKASTPYNGLLSFIENDLLGNVDKNSSLASLEASLSYFDKQVKEAQEKFEIIKQNTDSDIKSEIDYIVSEYASEIDENNFEEKFTLIDDALNQNISDIIDKNIQEILNDFHSSLSFLNSALHDASAFVIKDEYRRIKVRYDNSSLPRKFFYYASFGFIERKYGYVEEKVLMGNNKEKMIRSFTSNRIEAFVKNAKDNYSTVVNTFFNPLVDISKDIKKEIDALKQSIIIYKNTLKG